MIKNMLIAASEMLEKSRDKNVKCAKIVIDNIIKGMADEIPPQLSFNDDDVKVKTNGIDEIKKYQGPEIRREHKPKGKIVVKDGRIVEFEGLPLDAMVELDGVAMPHRDAIGKSFQNGKVL